MMFINQGKAAKRRTLNVLASLMLAVTTAVLLQGCTSEKQTVKQDRNSSVANEFISESELTKLLSYSKRKAGSVVSYYINYTSPLGTAMSRDLMMSRVSAHMEDFPQILISAESVFEKWRNKGWEHDYNSTYNGLDDINVAILKNYLDKKYSGRDIGEEYGISNQRLAHIIIQSDGLQKTFHSKTQGYVKEHQG